MASISFREATRWYAGTENAAVRDLNLDIDDGEFMVLVGPSGCGKSTTLRMLAGLELIDSGEIYIGDREISLLPPAARDIAMVFQNYALYPHMTVAENMGFALKMAKIPKPAREQKVLEAARLLDLEGYLGRKPKQLSGGQRQRVAMGRAIVREPAVFCMDEPLSNLDAKMRVRTRTDIAKLQRELAVTTVYVTHDQIEAMTMGDRVAVMHEGALQQVDTPLNLYDHPANLFVAGFIGSPQMNLLEGFSDGTGVSIGSYRTPEVPHGLPAGTRVTIGVRPESWRIVSNEDAGISIEVNVVEELGADGFAYGTSDIEGTPRDLIVRVADRYSVRRGDILRLAVDPDKAHVFDTETGTRLSVPARRG